MLIALFVLSGCDGGTALMDIEADAQMEVTIPEGVIAQYGMFQLEKKFQHLSQVENNDGSVTVVLNAQQVEQVEREVSELFLQYKQAVIQGPTNQVMNISYDPRYETIQFYVADASVIHEENFLLAEELLMKHALLYQLIHGEQLGINIFYYDDESKEFISEKMIPI